MANSFPMTNIPYFSPILNKHRLSQLTSPSKSYIWTVPDIAPFDELIISWNAERPSRGQFVILCSVLIKSQWSPWLLYAVWGDRLQFSFHEEIAQAPVRTYQDQVEILDGFLATGFRIRVECCNQSSLNHFYILYACTTLIKSHKLPLIPPSRSYPSLSYDGLSQLKLHHPRSTSLCSPTSTTSVIRYLQGHLALDPLAFAKQVYDSAFDIYGHWPFNVAQAFVELGNLWRCWCARVTDFKIIEDHLIKGYPVVISIKGPLQGSQFSYSEGHLLVIKGYDSKSQSFFCMDPAFPSDHDTIVSYSWTHLVQAWERRHYLTYFFSAYY